MTRGSIKNLTGSCDQPGVPRTWKRKTPFRRQLSYWMDEWRKTGDQFTVTSLIVVSKHTLRLNNRFCYRYKIRGPRHWYNSMHCFPLSPTSTYIWTISRLEFCPPNRTEQSYSGRISVPGNFTCSSLSFLPVSLGYIFELRNNDWNFYLLLAVPGSLLSSKIFRLFVGSPSMRS